VADADRSRAFYAGLGWRLEADFSFDNGFRVVPFTPPGSLCSAQFGTKITDAPPGSAHGLYLIVSDIEAGRDDLMTRGAKVSEVFHSGAPRAQLDPVGPSGRVSGPDTDHLSYSSFATFEGPNGNSWLLQEVTQRLPGRVDSAITSFNVAGDLAEAYDAPRPPMVSARSDIDAGEYSFRVAVDIETRADSLDWVNTGIFISVGGRQRGGVIYDVYLLG
jgi:catechol 2,3-dioxygenase-like lactoylglutathione lyase family enzyme